MAKNVKQACCSFCHKVHDQVEKLIGGNDPDGNDVGICDECIGVANEILEEAGVPIRN